ncbi:neither inactivation nor afterpotential protein C isoform X2 [Tribolium madens]|uniref:neither inactivation nor afterpotential protein C isoform X2 n=1 Tax=Tribolium madens TaxID=41895 RepID=UPI001CF72655|nr:neither inactivation nor afterpotential protein C isoform X2 [Tribolium madens]
MNLKEFPSPGDRYLLEDVLGVGAFGKVFSATDTQAGNNQVAIKTQKNSKKFQTYIEQEYKVLKDLSWHVNLPDFYAIFCQEDKVWFVLEVCSGGCVTDLVQNLLEKNRRMREEHIAYILKETIKAAIFLHENCCIHRDIRGKNILLTKNGDVKLADFGFSCFLNDVLDGTNECLGSPCWLAPEVITCKRTKKKYGNRVDVWSLGITAIELGDGAAPYHSMPPSRILFQIITNPPPTLYRKFNWSENYIDFINECLVKNAEHRPYMVEVINHPFLNQVPENNYHLTLEIKTLIDDLEVVPSVSPKSVEVVIIEEYVKSGFDGAFEKILGEDLASLDSLEEEDVMKLLEARFMTGQFQTFIGDILLIINSSEKMNVYGDEFHRKYHMKSRSDNEPHIFAVADSAYQNALHHHICQKIVLSGESGSGKTTNFFHLINHLLFLGQNDNINLRRIKNAAQLINSLTTAATPVNKYSTRCVFKIDVKYGNTGKVSGAVFNIFQLEKWRISCNSSTQGTFYFLYSVFEGLQTNQKLEKYLLNSAFEYKYLKKYQDTKNDHLINFEQILKIFEDFELNASEVDTILSIMSSILILGEMSFKNLETQLENEDKECIEKIAQLLQIDPCKFHWALTNYCLIKRDVIIKRKNTEDDAKSIRDVFVNNLYLRLVDYIVNTINNRLSAGRKIFGETYSIQILDYFGFECFNENFLSQLFVNSFNEQMHYYYTQRNFFWEYLDMKDEDLSYDISSLYYDNKLCLDELLGKSEGVFSVIDEASKMNQNAKYVINFIENCEKKFVKVVGKLEFSVAHYTGKVTYTACDICDKNRDFLPVEVIETLRLSDNSIVRSLFTNKLNKTGNLIVLNGATDKSKYKFAPKKPTLNQYSQIKHLTTSVRKFKALSVDLLKDLSKGSTHFIRCVRPNMHQNRKNFDCGLVKQQIRALEVVETAKLRQNGYPYRISFHEFLRRYKFLAFDFNENVETNRENCRLLLIRLGVEGWEIGKSKVFLKYYVEEYLSRLFETQVKKITKIQSILRRFLAKCLVTKRLQDKEKKCCLEYVETRKYKMSAEEAATIIQKAYRESNVKKSYQEFAEDYKILDEETCNFIRKFALKWKNNTIFRILLLYKSVRFQDCFNFSQQVHLYNIGTFYGLEEINQAISLDNIDSKANISVWLGENSVALQKMPFRLDEIPFYDTGEMSNLVLNYELLEEKNDSWDLPYRWRNLIFSKCDDATQTKSPTALPFARDSTQQEENKNDTNAESNVEETETKNLFKNEEKVNFNTKLANEDFDYIKSPSTKKVKRVDPVMELKQMGLKNASENEPPFNFQGMLRKTNFKKEVKMEENNTKILPYSLRKTPINGKSYESAEAKIAQNGIKITNNVDIIQCDKKKVKIQLAPGIVLEGFEEEI